MNQLHPLAYVINKKDHIIYVFKSHIKAYQFARKNHLSKLHIYFFEYDMYINDGFAFKEM